MAVTPKIMSVESRLCSMHGIDIGVLTSTGIGTDIDIGIARTRAAQPIKCCHHRHGHIWKREAEISL